MKSIPKRLVILPATLITLLAPKKAFATLRTWGGNTAGNFSTAGSSLTSDQAAGIVYSTTTFNGNNGVTYRIQAATDVVSPVWTNVSTNLVGISSTSTLTETNTTGSVKFYRVICT